MMPNDYSNTNDLKNKEDCNVQENQKKSSNENIYGNCMDTENTYNKFQEKAKESDKNTLMDQKSYIDELREVFIVETCEGSKINENTINKAGLLTNCDGLNMLNPQEKMFDSISEQMKDTIEFCNFETVEDSDKHDDIYEVEVNIYNDESCYFRTNTTISPQESNHYMNITPQYQPQPNDTNKLIDWTVEEQCISSKNKSFDLMNKKYETGDDNNSEFENLSDNLTPKCVIKNPNTYNKKGYQFDEKLSSDTFKLIKNNLQTLKKPDDDGMSMVYFNTQKITEKPQNHMKANSANNVSNIYTYDDNDITTKKKNNKRINVSNTLKNLFSKEENEPDMWTLNINDVRKSTNSVRNAEKLQPGETRKSTNMWSNIIPSADKNMLKNDDINNSQFRRHLHSNAPKKFKIKEKTEFCSHQNYANLNRDKDNIGDKPTLKNQNIYNNIGNHNAMQTKFAPVNRINYPKSEEGKQYSKKTSEDQNSCLNTKNLQDEKSKGKN